MPTPTRRAAVRQERDRLHDELAWLGHAAGRELVQGDRRSVVIHGDATEKSGRGTACPDRRQLVLEVRDRLPHLVGCVGKACLDRQETPPCTRVPIGSPNTARRMFPSSRRSKTMIGNLFSMQSETAVASITWYPSRSTSTYWRVSNRLAVG